MAHSKVISTEAEYKVKTLQPLSSREEFRKAFVSSTPSRVTLPISASMAMISESQILQETRTPDAIAANLIKLYNTLKPRWELYNQYLDWKQTGMVGTIPTFRDEVNGALITADFALAPCSLVNDSLNEFVNLTLKIYSSDKLQNVMKIARTDAETSFAVKELRQIAIHAEEAMEQEALGVIFKVVENCPDYKKRIENIVKRTKNIAESDALPNTPDIKLALFEALVVLLPQELQKQNPALYKEMVFPYFHNYIPLIKSELELLKVPFMLQNQLAPYFHSSLDELFVTNPGIYNALRNVFLRYKSSEAVKNFMGEYPEIFGLRELDKQTFTFVGAGFPLSGIIQHILTGGAKINLVECNKIAVDTARKLINITDSLGITRQDTIAVLHADARDVEYVPTKDISACLPREIGCDNSPKKRITLPTDVLDLASALPAGVTKQMLEDNAKDIHIIRKRSVRGTSEFLYERFPSEAYLKPTNFRLIGETSPPQQVINGSTPAELVTCISDAKNVNSGDLYINTNNLPKKATALKALAFKEPAIPCKTIFDTNDCAGSTQVKKVISSENLLNAGSDSMWTERVMTYYKVAQSESKSIPLGAKL